ncbi:Nitrobenzene nitroreductase [Alphaproteobacteria bacterium SO-S41]|nr:Nitrobenzene nitroreductase [Alphaproteobacteria bacterium SO-S41]
MNVTDAITQRISTRAFLDKPVGEAELRAILDVARFSPSGGNCQPWHVYALSGAGMARFRAELGDVMASDPMGEETEFHIYPPGIKEPYRSRRFKCGEDLYASIGIPRENKGGRLMQLAKNYDFFGAPAAFFFALDRQMGPGQWAHLGMLMQTICLTAEEMGLATCMQEAWARRHSFIRKFFGVPDELQLYCGLAVGYKDPGAPINSWRTERAPVDEIATFVS